MECPVKAINEREATNAYYLPLELWTQVLGTGEGSLIRMRWVCKSCQGFDNWSSELGLIGWNYGKHFNKEILCNPYFPNEFRSGRWKFAFGFDPSSSDYHHEVDLKVVAVPNLFVLRSVANLAIYSLQSGSWRTKNMNVDLEYETYLKWTPLLHDGALYWLAWHRLKWSQLETSPFWSQVETTVPKLVSKFELLLKV